MTAIFIPNGDGTTTVQITYTAATEKMLNFGNNAAEYVYYLYPVYDDTWVGDPAVEGPPVIPFADLTNQQKLDVLDKYMKHHLQENANANLVKVAVVGAREEAENDDSADIG